MHGGHWSGLLKTEEDADVESIIDKMFRITKILALKMYDCGVESGKQDFDKI